MRTKYIYVFSMLFVVIALALAFSPTVNAAGDAAKGKEKYDLFCTSCHGTEGKGDGPAGAALDPKARDLSDAAYVSTITDENLTNVIKNGGASVGKSAMMPAWGGALSDDDIANIVTYLRTEICKCEFKK